VQQPQQGTGGAGVDVPFAVRYLAGAAQSDDVAEHVDAERLTGDQVTERDSGGRGHRVHVLQQLRGGLGYLRFAALLVEGGGLVLVGDRVKIRLVNDMEQDHPMHHPFHVHGAGRFLVLSRDGIAEPNLVWKDTVLVRTGETVDILLDITNPGRWMAHCHIAEHHESGMMFSFDVDP
jgi:hypothetical protein